MSGADKGMMPDGGDDLIAAEYVLGVLDANSRGRVEARADADRAFAQLVAAWQVRLAPLDDDYAPVVPPASVKAALDRQLFAGVAQAKPGLWQSLYFWRSLSLATLALAAFVFVPAVLSRDPQLAKVLPIVAPMQADTGEVRFVALYEPGAAEIRITRIKADKQSGRDFELWLIEEDGKPKSMGVIPDGQTLALKVTPDLIARITAGDTFAVTDEPAGGSPTGGPTGPVVAAGASRAI